jgi:hypothetical protein
VHLARWAAACRKGERLAFFTGHKGDQSVLVAVESHFLGAWMPVSYLESPADMLAGSPWRDELDEVPWLATASGVTTTTVDVDPAALDIDGFDPDAAAPDGPPPWVPARLDGKCAGCGDPIKPGDEIQADGDGGWVCRDCGTGDDPSEREDTGTPRLPDGQDGEEILQPGYDAKCTDPAPESCSDAGCPVHGDHAYDLAADVEEDAEDVTAGE